MKSSPSALAAALMPRPTSAAPDATAIDNFIKRKFEESGRDFFTSKERIMVEINPAPDRILTGHDAAIILGRERPVEGGFIEKSLDRVAGAGRGEIK